MFAAGEGHTDVVKMLHEFGANVNYQEEVSCYQSVQLIKYESDFTKVM